jgi:hypothetical protein
MARRRGVGDGEVSASALGRGAGAAPATCGEADAPPAARRRYFAIENSTALLIA